MCSTLLLCRSMDCINYATRESLRKCQTLYKIDWHLALSPDQSKDYRFSPSMSQKRKSIYIAWWIRQPMNLICVALPYFHTQFSLVSYQLTFDFVEWARQQYIKLNSSVAFRLYATNETTKCDISVSTEKMYKTLKARFPSKLTSNENSFSQNRYTEFLFMAFFSFWLRTAAAAIAISMPYPFHTPTTHRPPQQ